MTRRRPGALGAVAVVVSVAVAAPAAAGVRTSPALATAFVVAMLLGSAASVWVAARGALSVRRLLLVAVALRVLTLPMQPSLSDDVYRYLWDGELILAGVSPYAHVPADPALDAFREVPSHRALFDAMNSPGYFSVYPPVSQAAFAAAAWPVGAQTEWFTLKGLLVLIELLGIALLARVVDPTRLALYAWSPVAAVEIAGQGHTEGLLVGAVGLLWWALATQRVGVAGVGVVLAGWTKLFPFALGLLVFKRWRAAGGWLVGIAALALGLGAPLRADGGLANLLTSVRLYGGSLDFYSAPFLILKAATYPFLGEESGRLASAALSGLWAVWLARAAWLDDGSRQGARRLVVIVLVGYALTAAMAHPWNLLGALVAAPLMRRPLPVVWLVGLAPLTYARYAGAEGLYTAALVLGWGGAALLWALARYRARPASASTVSAAGATRS